MDIIIRNQCYNVISVISGEYQEWNLVLGKLLWLHDIDMFSTLVQHCAEGKTQLLVDPPHKEPRMQSFMFPFW